MHFTIRRFKYFLPSAGPLRTYWSIDRSNAGGLSCRVVCNFDLSAAFQSPDFAAGLLTVSGMSSAAVEALAESGTFVGTARAIANRLR
ncbi:hypothetical protein H6CHR_00680 [Variovorax sp. PBL-H6]|nr:hypothetical protein H6CHR_00680 [Variovorax sp. PBL-H6]